MIFAEALNAGYSGILFGRARVSVERMLLDVRRLVEPSLAERVSAYKSGYRADERARIEAGLRSGHLRGVVSTNALELGIDVGSLDLAVVAGYPGSSMSFWQQAGRVGRRGERESLVVLVAGDDALDQFHIQHPEAFFGRAMEHAAVDPSNAAIQLGHLLCAASEAPLEAAELDAWPANASALAQRLVDAGELSGGPPWRCPGGAPHADVSLRGTSRTPYSLQIGREVLGTIEPPWLQRECYPGAVYLHNGRGYRVAKLDPTAHVVRLELDGAEGRTNPLLEVAVMPRGEAVAQRSVASLEASLGPLSVRESVVAYRELRRGQALTFGLEQPLESVLDTIGLWLDVPPALEADGASIHAFEHALVSALPLVLLCDRRDVGSSNEGQRIFIYDFAEGGIGLADKAYHLFEELVERAASLVRTVRRRAARIACTWPRGRQSTRQTGAQALPGIVGAARAAAGVMNRPACRDLRAHPRAPPTLHDIAGRARARYGASPRGCRLARWPTWTLLGRSSWNVGVGSRRSATKRRHVALSAVGRARTPTDAA
jgi:DEAD/DEAH box helicase domain-containing protein